MSTYLTESNLADGRLALETALGVTPSGAVDHPVFCTGFVTRGDVVAAGLLAVADVAGSRYADAGLAKRLASLDPVVTASGDRLRFESFSACNGVHARFDLMRSGLGSSEVGFGTTNVDINQPLRTALARVGRAQPLHVSVGSSEIRLATLEATHVERKVALPDRWVRGFAEVPAIAQRMTLEASLEGPAIARLIGCLPRVAPPGPTVHVVPMGPVWRTSTRPMARSVPIPGVSRLRGSDRILRHATALRLFRGADGSTAWVFDVPGGRLTLLLSPDPYRGFSGEGTLLSLLARGESTAAGRRLLEDLAWQPVIDPAELADRTGLTPSAVASGLAWLAASGRLGYDLAESTHFHRDLPVEADRVLGRNPRLRAAQRLASESAVEPQDEGWRVRGDHDVYAVTADLRCSCPWEDEHAGARGPCKHVLAVLLTVSPG